MRYHNRMHRNILYRFTALTMAFLLMFSSVGYSVDMHICRGKVKHFSFFGKAEDCFGHKQSCSNLVHKKSSKQTFSKKKCCTNVSFSVDHIDINAGLTKSFSSKILFCAGLLPSFLDIDLFIPTSGHIIVNHLKSIPPLILRDFCVLFQNFLI